MQKFHEKNGNCGEKKQKFHEKCRIQTFIEVKEENLFMTMKIKY